jgi:hypothetical protein
MHIELDDWERFCDQAGSAVEEDGAFITQAYPPAGKMVLPDFDSWGGIRPPQTPPISRPGSLQIWICILDVISRIWIYILDVISRIWMYIFGFW